MMKNSLPKALYVHVPFCDNICGYCDFCRVGNHGALADQWLDELKNEIEQRLKEVTFETIYIGGGTPSCLSINQLERLFRYLKPYSEQCIEYTIELNPETVDDDKIN